jgi:choline dehydrogenase-like flavoprotein
MHDHFDVIIIGTGAGGGTLLHRVAPSGKRILVLERGPFLPREKDNWNYHGSFKYYSSEVMFNRDGGEIRPGFSYFVGGNTKVYGAALFRLREKDFESFRHRDGISPEWPIKYRDWEDYYTQAEELYQVHGQAGEDPTEPWRSRAYPFPPISHEPRIAEVFEILKARGLKPYPAPMGVRLNEAAPHLSTCIRCDTCDGYPCLVGAKSDADVTAVRPSLPKQNVTLITEAKVLRLHTSASGREVTGVVAEVKGETRVFRGDVVVVSCGAVNSSALLLRSANDRHPRGLANNSSRLVGRNLMKHVLGSLVGVSTLKPNPSKFQKTMAINDFYWGEPGYEFPMGNIQLMGKTVIEGLRGYEDKYAPLTIEEVAKNSIDWWLTTEDLPEARNQVRVEGDQRIIVDYTENNSEPFDRLVERWKGILKEIGCGCHIVPQANYFTRSSGRKSAPISGKHEPTHVGCYESKSGYFTTKMPMHSLGHQVGTCRFGEDPKTSVLDLNCRAHDLDNLYVVDGSFFVSSGAVNPTLTIIANALRVGDHLLERLGASEPARQSRNGTRKHALTPETAAIGI